MTKKIDLPADDIFKEMFSRLDPKEYKEFMRIIDDLLLMG